MFWSQTVSPTHWSRGNCIFILFIYVLQELGPIFRTHSIHQQYKKVIQSLEEVAILIMLYTGLIVFNAFPIGKKFQGQIFTDQFSCPERVYKNQRRVLLHQTSGPPDPAPADRIIES